MFVSQVPCADAGASRDQSSRMDWSTQKRWVVARNDKWALRVLGLQALPEGTGDHAVLSTAGRQDALALRVAQSDDGGVSDEGEAMVGGAMVGGSMVGGSMVGGSMVGGGDAEAAEAAAAAAAARAQQEADADVSPLSHTLAAVAVVLSPRTAATVGVVSEAPTFLFL